MTKNKYIYIGNAIRRIKRGVRLSIFVLGISLAFNIDIFAQETDGRIYVTPLFEYPIAPESLPDLQSKSDWLMDHFWDSMDFKNPDSVDQNALNDALNVYGSACIYASKEKVLHSIDKLTQNIKGNPTLTLQFTKGIEEIFYGPRAIAWVDEFYIPFLNNVISEKNISDTRKIRYKELLDMLKRNAIGKKIPTLRLTLRDGKQTDFKPKADYTIIEFGNPDCEDCRFSRMKLEMASDLMEMVDSKKLDIVFIVADSMPEEEPEILKQLSGYPGNWITGILYGGDDIFDLRTTPSFYILNSKGEILAKNITATDAVRVIRDLNSK